MWFLGARFVARLMFDGFKVGRRMTETKPNEPSQPSQRSWLPKRTLILSLVLLALSFAFRLLLARAQRACELVSDQCADAGFAWEVFASVTFIGAVFAVFIALLMVIIRLLRPLGRPVQAIVLVCAALFVAKVVDNFIHFGQRAKLGECIDKLDEIRQAQADHYKKTGQYIAAARRPKSQPNGTLLWEDQAKDSGWQKLGWTDSMRTYCQYEVVVQGDDYLAKAFCDVDKDGEEAVFEASKDRPPQRMTANDIY